MDGHRGARTEFAGLARRGVNSTQRTNECILEEREGKALGDPSRAEYNINNKEASSGTGRAKTRAVRGA